MFKNSLYEKDEIYEATKKIFKRFIFYRINEYFNISLNEFMKLPIERYNIILEIAEELIEQERKSKEKIRGTS